MDEDQIQPIVAGDSKQQMQEKINKAIADVNAARKDGAEAKALAEQLKGELRAIREANAFNSRAPTDSENQIEARYLRSARDGTPLVRMYGSVNQDLGEYEPGLLDDVTTHGEWHGKVKQAASDACLVALVKSKRKAEVSSADPHDVQRLLRRHAPRALRRLNHHLRNAPDAVRRIFNNTSGEGSEFIPTEIRVPEIEWALGLLTQQLASNLFPSDPMSGPTVINPFFGFGLTPYAMGPGVEDDPPKHKSSSASTDERSRTAKKYGVRTQVDADAAEDSIVDSKAVLIEGITRALALGKDDLLFNGNLYGSLVDTEIASWNPRDAWATAALGSTVDHRFRWEGLRARAQRIGGNATYDMNGSITLAKLLAMRSRLAAPRGMDGDLILFAPEEVYIEHLLAIDEVTTVDKYGAAATVVSGELGRIAGMRIVPAFMLTADMNASGVYDNVTTDKGQMVLTNRMRHRFGVRRGTRTEFDTDIERQIGVIVASLREILWSPDASTDINVVQAYDI